MRFANNWGPLHIRTPEGFMMVDIDISKLNSESTPLAALAPLNYINGLDC